MLYVNIRGFVIYKLIKIYISQVLISNMVNTDTYNPHKQELLGILNIF